MHARRDGVVDAACWSLLAVLIVDAPAVAADLPLKPARPRRPAAPASAPANASPLRRAQRRLPGMDGRLPGLSARAGRRGVMLQRRHRLRSRKTEVHAA